MDISTNPARGRDGITYEITDAELVAANRGQRNDILALKDAFFRTPNQSVYGVSNGQLVPVTSGGASLTSAGIFTPPTNDYAGIMSAYTAAMAAGGGTIFLDGYFNIGANTIPLNHCIKYQGAGWRAEFQNNGLPNTGFGTVIEGNGTADGFACKTTPLGSDDGGNAYIVSTGISDMALVNFRRGINSGATNSRGVYSSTFENLSIHNCTDWGMYFENTEQMVLNNITLEGNANGWYLGANVAGFNPGDSPMVNFVYCQDGLGGNCTYRSRHIWLNARTASSALNGMALHGSGANGPYFNQVFAVAGTATNGNANIACADTSRFAVGMPVILNAAVAPFVAKRIYFIKSLVANTSIQLCDADYTDVYTGVNAAAAIVPSASGAVTIKTKGFAGIQVSSSTASRSVTGLRLNNCNSENAGTAQFLFQGTDYCAINGGEPNAVGPNFEVTSLWAVCLRDTYEMTVNLGHSGLVDSTSRWIGFSPDSDGLPPGGIYANNHGSGFGIRGFSGNAAGLYLQSQSNTPLLRQDASTAYAYLGNGIALKQDNIGAGTINSNYGNVLSAASSGITFTLPTIDAVSTRGLPLFISNPHPAALTVNTSSSQNIIGLGVSGTSTTIAANSSAILVAMNGPSLYWARFA